MVSVDELGHWVGCDVLRVGLLAHAPAGRSLHLEGCISVLVPTRKMSLRIEGRLPGRRYRAELAGPSVSVLPPCASLDVEESSPGALVVLALDGGFMRERLHGTDRRVRGTPMAADPYLNRMGSLLRGALKSDVAPPPLYLRCLAEDLREHVYRWYTRRSRRQAPAALSDERLCTARAFMEEHFGDKDLGVEDIAASVGLSPFHFTRLFTTAVGKAPHAYLTDLRMQEARRLLGETCIAIADIAKRSGYATHAHFTGVFGRHVGMSPATYRTHVRAERAKARRDAA